MTPGYALILGAAFGSSLWLVITALTPSSPDLRAVAANLSPHRDTTPRRGTPTPPAGLTQRVGALIERRVTDRPGFTPPLQDLEILGKTTRDYWGQKALCAALGFLIPLILQGALTLFSLDIGWTIPALACLAGAALMWFLPDVDYKEHATKTRRDFLRAAVAYLQLVAIHRRAGSGATSALREAANISDHWMFQRIRSALHHAHVTGVPAWDGLETLGTRTGMPELAEVGDIMRIAGEGGAQVYDTLLARAKSLSDKVLADDHAAALAAATRMSIPTGLLPTLLIVIALFPAVMTLTGGG